MPKWSGSVIDTSHVKLYDMHWIKQGSALTGCFCPFLSCCLHVFTESFHSPMAFWIVFKIIQSWLLVVVCCLLFFEFLLLLFLADTE